MLIRLLLPCLILSLTPQLNHATLNPFSWFGVKAKPDYPVPHKLVKDMDKGELEKVLAYGKEINDSELIFKCYFYLIGLSAQQGSIKVYKLELADYCFSRQDYERAANGYEEFFILYPGSLEAEYAQYKSILCSFYLSLSSDRDQTPTLKTISLIQFFLQKAKNVKFIDEVKEIYTTCRQKLFEHEVHIFAHYISRQKFVSAQKRLEFIEKNFTDIVNFEQYVAYCKEMMEIMKNPQTRPFLLKFDLKNALVKKEKESNSSEQTTAVQKITSFFLA